MRSRPIDERFVEKLSAPTSAGCIEWTGYTNTNGYGRMCAGPGKPNVLTHRYAYERIKGPVPDGLRVLHRCDNPRCCNIDHLFIGSMADNTEDMLKKGRQAKSRVTSDDLSDMMLMKGHGMMQKDIAREYGLAPCTVSQILNGKIMVSPAA